MLEVYFKILNEISDLDALRRFQCEWLEQRFLDRQKVLVVLDEAQLDSFDRVLWVFKDAALVPHRRMGLASNFTHLNDDYPIGLTYIGHLEADPSLANESDWILNDSVKALPVSLEGKILELVPNILELKTRKRQHYRAYCEQRLQPKMLKD